MNDPQRLWGADGWRWERVHPDSLFSAHPEHLEVQKKFMLVPARCGGESRQGGPAMKVETWRNAHWFVDLHRDETVLCASPLNAGAADGSMEGHPPMISLSMRRTDRSNGAFHDWREMQRVKNELVGPDNEAVELYPGEDRMVDTADQFHLWCFEQEHVMFPFGYLDREVGDSNPGGSQRARTNGDVS